VVDSNKKGVCDMDVSMIIDIGFTTKDNFGPQLTWREWCIDAEFRSGEGYFDIAFRLLGLKFQFGLDW